MVDQHNFDPPGIRRMSSENKLIQSVYEKGTDFPPSVSTISLNRDKVKKNDDVETEENGSDVYDIDVWSEYLGDNFDSADEMIDGLSLLLKSMEEVEVNEEDDESNLFAYSPPTMLDKNTTSYICLMSGGKFEISYRFIEERLEDLRATMYDEDDNEEEEEEDVEEEDRK